MEQDSTETSTDTRTRVEIVADNARLLQKLGVPGTVVQLTPAPPLTREERS